MHKSVIASTIVFVLSCSCGTAASKFYITSDECWTELPISGHIQGNAIIYYFPNETTFAANIKCPEKTIFLSMPAESKNKVELLFNKGQQVDPHVIGVSFKADIAGTLYQNAGSERVLIKLSSININYSLPPSFIVQK